MTNSVISLSGFSRHATDVASLQPELLASLSALAAAFVGVLLADQRAVVTVEGFADFDAQDHEFENKVSLQRAISPTGR